MATGDDIFEPVKNRLGRGKTLPYPQLLKIKLPNKAGLVL
jgi:hypothetical protein